MPKRVRSLPDSFNDSHWGYQEGYNREILLVVHMLLVIRSVVVALSGVVMIYAFYVKSIASNDSILLITFLNHYSLTQRCSKWLSKFLLTFKWNGNEQTLIHLLVDHLGNFSIN